MKIGLLGGGITNLAVGYYLKKPYEILEKEDRLGGLCKSIIDNGFTFDPYGAHILFSKNKSILDLEKKLMGNNLKTRFRTNKVYINGKIVKYPFENDLGSLNKEDTYECLYHYLFNNYPKPKNLKEWFLHTFGRGIAQKYLIPYNAKIWKIDPEQLGMEWVERIPKPPKEDIIKSALGIPTEGYKYQLNFLYPEKEGVESLIKAFEKVNQGTITTKYKIDGIYYEKNKWIITSGNNKRVYEKIVSTIPIFVLFRFLKNIKIPKHVSNALNTLEYRSLITIMLGLDTPALNNYTAIYFPDPDFMPHRVSFPPNFSPLTVPLNHFSLMAEITVPKNKSYFKISNEEIYKNVIDGLVKRNIIKSGSVIYRKIQTEEYAYPIYSLDYTKNMKIIRDFLAQIGIEICGRFGSFQYINVDVCIEQGIRIAEKLNIQK